MQRWTVTMAMAMAMAIALGLALSACGGGSGTETADETPTTTTEPPTTTTTRPIARDACLAPLLATAAQAQFPEATVVDQSCSSTYAIATIDGPTTDAVIGYFQIGADGRWTLATVGRLDGDQFVDRPEGLPDALIGQWRRAYSVRVVQEQEAARIAAEEAARVAEEQRLEDERRALEELQKALEAQATSTTVPPAPAP